MLARHATRAGTSRASFVGGVSPPAANERKTTKTTQYNAQPVSTFGATDRFRRPSPRILGASNDAPTTPGRPGWKYAYEDLLWSKQNLPLNLRAVLQVLLRLSDHLGRVWWSQAAIAEQAGCTVRTLRRLLPALETSGFARVEAMTFRQLAIVQASLGLPLPGRNDDGHAPDLITLLVQGNPAHELRPAPRKRTSSPGQIVLGPPRTNLSFDRPNQAVDPEDSSSDDPRDLSVDLNRNVGDPICTTHPSVPLVQEDKKADAPALHDKPVTPRSSCTEETAWLALEAAYDAHYRRVYHARPTSKPLPMESRMLMAGHLADMATLLQARFVERNVDLSRLEKPPVELLADEALRVWFDSAGSNDYLRRVSHRMGALPADLPYRARKALENLLERHAPKPEPRRAALPSIPMPQLNIWGSGSPSAPCAPTLQLSELSGQSLPGLHRSTPEPGFAARSAPVKPPITKTNISPDVARVLQGLSQHSATHDLSESPALAQELVLLATERSVSIAELLDGLEVVAKVCQRQRTATAAVRSGLVYKLLVDRFDPSTPRRSTA